MAISIDWLTKVVTVPQSFLTPVSGSLYELDIEAFRNALKDIEDSEAGIVHPKTHNRNAPVTLSGDTYAQTLEMINGYTVTFSEEASPYRVKCVGANHNISDVQNLNDVSLIIGNSAGLVVGAGGGGGASAADVWAYATRTLTSGGAGLSAQEVRDAMKLAPTAGAPATGSIDRHLDDIPTNPLLTNDGRLANLDATISSRLATAGYTTPPTAGAVADEVRLELATELGRVDVAVSSRLATAGYTAPPTAAAVADEVRVELATELARLDAAVSSRLATAGYTAPPTVAQYWQYVIEAGYTAEQLMRLLASVAAADATGINGETPVFRDLADTKTRLAASMSGGDRAITTRDAT